MARYSPSISVSAGVGTADNPTINITYEPADGTSPQIYNADHIEVTDSTTGQTGGLNGVNLPPFGFLNATEPGYLTTYLSLVRNGTFNTAGLILDDFYGATGTPWSLGPYSNGAPDITSVNLEIKDSNGKTMRTIPVQTRNIWRPSYITVPTVNSNGNSIRNALQQHLGFAPKVYFDSNDAIIVLKFSPVSATGPNNTRVVGTSGVLFVAIYIIDGNGGIANALSAEYVIPGGHSIDLNNPQPITEHIAVTFSKSKGIILIFSGLNPTEDYIQIIGDPQNPNLNAPRIPFASGRGGYNDNWENKSPTYHPNNLSTAGRLYNAEIVYVDTPTGTEEVLALHWTDPRFSTGSLYGYNKVYVGSYYGLTNSTTVALYPMFRIDDALTNSTVVMPSHYVEAPTISQGANDNGFSSVGRSFYDSSRNEILSLFVGNGFYINRKYIVKIPMDDLQALISTSDMTTTYIPTLSFLTSSMTAPDVYNGSNDRFMSTSLLFTMPDDRSLFGYLLRDQTGSTYPFVRCSGLMYVAPNVSTTVSSVTYYHFPSRDLPLPGVPPATTGNIRPNTYFGIPYISTMASVTPQPDSKGRWAIVAVEDPDPGSVSPGQGITYYMAVYPSTT